MVAVINGKKHQEMTSPATPLTRNHCLWWSETIAPRHILLYIFPYHVIFSRNSGASAARISLENRKWRNACIPEDILHIFNFLFRSSGKWSYTLITCSAFLNPRLLSYLAACVFQVTLVENPSQQKEGQFKISTTRLKQTVAPPIQ